MELKSAVWLSDYENQAVTFYPLSEGNFYLGYRFLEGKPEFFEGPIQNYESHSSTTRKAVGPSSIISAQADRVHNSWLCQFNEDVSAIESKLDFNTNQNGSATVKVDQYFDFLDLIFDFVPVPDGIEITLQVTTSREIKGSCLMQQCLRFKGALNQEWRTKIARVPYLSELDMHAMGRPNATLTFYRHEAKWRPFPVQYTKVETQRNAHPPQQDLVADHGLVIRESPHREMAPNWYWERVAPGTKWDQISAGMYWERTAWISNRHPADCVHAAVDIGPLPAGGSRILHGKVYYLEGSKERLLKHWQKDFSIRG